MSRYDTIERTAKWWVRIYCEVPMDDQQPVMLSLGDRDTRDINAGPAFTVEYLSIDDAVSLATALLDAVKSARHALKVDKVMEGTR